MNTNFNNVFDWNTRDGGLCARIQVDPLPSDPDCLFRSFETTKLMHFMWLRRKATNHKMSSDEPSEELRNYSGHVNSHFSAALDEFIVAFCWWCGGDRQAEDLPQLSAAIALYLWSVFNAYLMLSLWYYFLPDS